MAASPDPVAHLPDLFQRTLVEVVLEGRIEQLFERPGHVSERTGRTLPGVVAEDLEVGGASSASSSGNSAGWASSRCGSCPSGRECPTRTSARSSVGCGSRRRDPAPDRPSARDLLGRVVRPGGISDEREDVPDLVGEIRRARPHRGPEEDLDPHLPVLPPRSRRDRGRVEQRDRPCVPRPRRPRPTTADRFPMTDLAVVSRSTSPLAQPGVGDGGLNVYVRELASSTRAGGRLLHRLPSLATWPAGRHRRRARVHRGPRGRGLGGPRQGGPPRRAPRRHQRGARGRPRRAPDALFAHYWLSGWSGTSSSTFSTCR